MLEIAELNGCSELSNFKASCILVEMREKLFPSLQALFFDQRFFLKLTRSISA